MKMSTKNIIIKITGNNEEVFHGETNDGKYFGVKIKAKILNKLKYKNEIIGNKNSILHV